MTARLADRSAIVERLRPWVDTGVLTTGDAQIAAAICQLSGDTDALVALGIALAVRAPRSGHVALDPFTIENQVLADVERLDPDSVVAVIELDWPSDPVRWLAAVSNSPAASGDASPVIVDDHLVYLRRFHTEECRVADALLQKSTTGPGPAHRSLGSVSDTLHLDDSQRQAVEQCLDGPLGILVGGPGTGKTRTVAAVLAALLADSPGDHTVALAAPTGKAAGRLGESMTDSLGLLRTANDRVLADVAERLSSVEPTTVHRLVGLRPGGRPRHHAGRPLPHDVIVIDEASMLSLSLMDSLLGAVRPDARLILVGDPGQLASVSAGSVLADIVDADGPLRRRVAELTESRRFPSGSRIGRFAAAIRAGDADTASAVLADTASADTASAELSMHPDIAVVAGIVGDGARSLAATAADGDVAGSVAALESRKVLCAHRRGPAGVSHWNHLVESLVAAAGLPVSGMYPGRPILVTANDPSRGLFNGDLGVAVDTPDGTRVAFGPAGAERLVPPAHLDSIETVHAMTIHKSQGSEFDHVVVVLPSHDSRLATRELLYTAVTRARRSVTLVGDPESVRAAIRRTESRSSGLRGRLTG